MAPQAAADVFQRHDEAVQAMGSVGMHLQCGSGQKGGKGGGEAMRSSKVDEEHPQD
jgi:hypothetical protein